MKGMALTGSVSHLSEGGLGACNGLTFEQHPCGAVEARLKAWRLLPLDWSYAGGSRKGADTSDTHGQACGGQRFEAQA